MSDRSIHLRRMTYRRQSREFSEECLWTSTKVGDHLLGFDEQHIPIRHPRHPMPAEIALEWHPSEASADGPSPLCSISVPSCLADPHLPIPAQLLASHALKQNIYAFLHFAMVASLRFPFSSLSVHDFLSRGSGGHIFIISQRVVLKCPAVFDNPAPQQAEEMEESAGRIAREKAMYKILTECRHPNILRCILPIPQGLFLERMETTLQARIDNETLGSASTQARWIRQITSAIAWLEELGYVHGDLRPANILLTAKDDVRLADFDASVRTGEKLLVASEPFCKLDEEFEVPYAGPVSEQFSLGSCIYTIRLGHLPHHELDAPDRIKKLIRSEFPATAQDGLFGDVTLKCWLGEYASLDAIDRDIESRFEASASPKNLGAVGDETHRLLLAECEEFCRRADNN